MSFIIDQTVEFLHVPKTAGVWIEEICKPWIKPAGTNHDRGIHTQKHVTQLPSFAVARNPYSWMKSCVGYTQGRWIIVEKNYPGWFPDVPYMRIGRLKSLRVKGAHINDVLKEYLAKMPGTYSRATLTWYENADRLIKFEDINTDLFAYFREMELPHARKIEYKGGLTPPLNTSKDLQTNADPALITALNEAEHEWFDHMEAR